MGYVFPEIILPLILAFLVGILLGWMLWRWRRTKVSWSEWETNRTALIESQQRVQLLSSEHADLDQRLQSLTGDLSERDERLSFLGADVDLARNSLRDVENELEAARLRALKLQPFGPGSHAPLADRSMSVDYPIKGNADSMLYHRPDSRSYRATVAEVWFDLPSRAEAAGFALAASHPTVDVPNTEPSGPSTQAIDLDPLLAPSPIDLRSAVDLEDNLLLIDGVGPKLEQFLHREGIRTFRQLADLNDADVEKLQDKLPEFPDRIRREGWVPQAQGILRGEGVRVPGAAERDDLQRIKGVGPVLERWLHGQRIFRFSQLASLEEAGIAELDDKLEDFPGRIRREAWIEQSAVLAAELVD
jgi:predicted flap endonuclease-1-like 5' DNA nuclease